MKKLLMAMLMFFLLATITANAAGEPINDSILLNDIYSLHLDKVKIIPITDPDGNIISYDRIATLQLKRHGKVVDMVKVRQPSAISSFILTDGAMTVTGNNVSIFIGSKLYYVVIRPLDWSYEDVISTLPKVILEN